VILSCWLLTDAAAAGRHSKAFRSRLTVPTEAEADKAFHALADGGQVQMPLAKTFFSARFGMVADKFGVSWMVLVTPNSRE
jgi:PhnB protein